MMTTATSKRPSGMTHFVSIGMILVLACTGPVISDQRLLVEQLCQLRCTAKCVIEEKQTSDFCAPKCEESITKNLCSGKSRDVEFCWRTCGGVLNEGPAPLIPDSIGYVYTSNYTLNFTWNGDGTVYLIELISHIIDSPDHVDQFVTVNPELFNYTRIPELFCTELLVRIASVNTGGISEFSKPLKLPIPSPDIVQNLSLISMNYFNKPFNDNGYHSNGTVQLVLQFEEAKKGKFPGEQPRTLVGNVGADLMYRKCQFLYYVSGVQSSRCGTVTSNSDLDDNSMKPLKIDCSTVTDSPCSETPKSHRPPMCGQVEAFSYVVVQNHHRYRFENITVNVSFSSTLASRWKPLYFVAFYGDAKPFDREIDVELLGVDMYNILGNSSNCPEFSSNGTCAIALNRVNGSLEIGNLKADTLYGVMICAVIDPLNLTFPTVDGVSPGMKSKANKIFIDSSVYSKTGYGSKLLLTGLLLSIIPLALLVAFIYMQYRHSIRLKLQQIKMEQFKTSIAMRYTDLPKKNDCWELERRNLVICDDERLGSGAFGAVYKGRLIGMAKGSRNAQSSLGVNLMRAQNCDVAVKMLPEYADDMSKSDFLREIGLMKTLGYHERLVNMLACITQTEPYCLIVEFCSDGDLLKFLRTRCNYMIKLSESGIDYDDCAELDDQIDVDMIVTLKQLLMFAVQISYGLEYLSQKGFVHRDVAARNVLVHERNNAKIGDFGLCRYIYANCANYKGKGGRLPVKWMSPEAIRHYEFTTKSDVWSFGVLIFEIITLGGSPYPGVQPDDMLEYLETGRRMAKPDNCPENLYLVMKSCWTESPELRPNFGLIRQKLASQLEEITDEYCYLKLDSHKEYYNIITQDINTNELQTDQSIGDQEVLEIDKQSGDQQTPKNKKSDQFDNVSLSSVDENDSKLNDK